MESEEAMIELAQELSLNYLTDLFALYAGKCSEVLTEDVNEFDIIFNQVLSGGTQWRT